MRSAYDNYDYASYWKSRIYEQRSEEIAISKLLKKVPKVDTVLEIGAGYGRVSKPFLKKGNHILLTDPSSKLLAIAKKNIKSKKIKYLKSSLEDLPKHSKKHSVDLVVLIRVMHHIVCCKTALKVINVLIKPGGYLLIEFPNKMHIKNKLRNITKGNLKYFKSEIPIDIFEAGGDSKVELPFKNYHPKMIVDLLKSNGFEIISKRSVSNIRSARLKTIFNSNILVFFERLLQKPLSIFDFGPSIFILARKKS
jgi:ubiquinone/menaquinone biosynthesis C-methylase UbiE